MEQISNFSYTFLISCLGQNCSEKGERAKVRWAELYQLYAIRKQIPLRYTPFTSSWREKTNRILFCVPTAINFILLYVHMKKCLHRNFRRIFPHIASEPCENFCASVSSVLTICRRSQVILNNISCDAVIFQSRHYDYQKCLSRFSRPSFIHTRTETYM